MRHAAPPLVERDGNSSHISSTTAVHTKLHGSALSGAPSTALEALDVLNGLQHVGNAQWSNILDALAGCEAAIGALVTDAQARVALSRAEAAAAREAEETASNRERLVRRRRRTELCLSASNSAEESESEQQPLLSIALPFWAEASGSLRLVRASHSLKSPEVGRLELNARVAVLDRRKTPDGAWRCAVALEGGGGRLHGWMTLLTKDGLENISACVPQPAVPLPPPLSSCSSRSDLGASGGATGGGGGGSACGSLSSRVEGLVLTPRLAATGGRTRPGLI